MECHVIFYLFHSYQVIRYRVVWLLGEWVTVKMSPSLRPSLYSIVVPLLAQKEHIAVRMFVCRCVCVCYVSICYQFLVFVFRSDWWLKK